MDNRLENDPRQRAILEYQLALSAVNRLPDKCAMDVGELASRIGADKLALISWARTDLGFARLVESKVTK